MSLLPPIPRRSSGWSISSSSQPPTPASESRNKTGDGESTPTFNPHSLLRRSEQVSIAQPCRVRSGAGPFVKAEAVLVSSKQQSLDEAAILIVAPPTHADAVAILYAIPIIPGFKHRLEQTPPSPSTSFFQQSAKPHITLYISCEDTKLELRIAASQSAKVQKLVAELRRLGELAAQSTVPRSLTHPWLNLYPVTRSDKKDNVDELASPEVEVPGALVSAAASAESPSDEKKGEPTNTEKEDPEYPDPYHPSFSRTRFLRQRLYARQEEWSKRQPVRIRIATYNVNDKVPPQGTLELAPLTGSGEEDILVFGFQEADLRRQSLLLSQGNSRAEGWEAALLAGIGANSDQFEKLVMTQYVGVMMIILVRKTLKEAITRVETSERGIGILGFGGNKAGVAVRMKVHDTTFCFVNAHMAAFATALDRRRSDYQTLRASLSFARPNDPDLTPAFEEFLPENKDKLLSQEDAHVLFWLGDLNYRIDLPDDDVKKLVEEKKWLDMLEKDQLRQDVASGQSLAGFQEPDITFPPTFKFVHGSTTHDLRRGPAYTDRVLYTLPANPYTPTAAHALQSNEYTSHEILWSDHRPVSATYTAQVRVVDESSRAVEFGAVMKELDRLEEVYRPSLEIETTSLEFGSISYRRPVERELKIRNIGKVSATYSFKPPAPDKPFCKLFIWPLPATAVVEPGQELTLKIVISVDEEWSARLTLGAEEINDVLVLQIAGGKDVFITLQATYLPSIISIPLHVLSTLPSPIRDVLLADRRVLGRPLAPSTTNGEAPVKPVRDVWKLLEYLMAHGQHVEGLWVDKEEVLDIIDCVDAGRELPPGAPKKVASALLHIFAALPTPLLPISHHTACLDASDRDEAFAVLEGVPQINTNILIGLISVVKLCSGLGQPIARELAVVAEPEGKAKETIKETVEQETISDDTSEPSTSLSLDDPAVVGKPTPTTDFKEGMAAGEFVIGDDETGRDTPEEESDGKRLSDKLDEMALASKRATSKISSKIRETLDRTVSHEKVIKFTTPPKAVKQEEIPVTPSQQQASSFDTSSKEPSTELVDALSPAIFGLVSQDASREKRNRFIKLLLEG
ncbi:hypothetical protein IAU60_000391 [Kwoniella sp. DSM 27419]